jgi:hypothetical protein
VVIGTFHSGYCSTLNIDGSGLFSAQLIDPPAQNLSAIGHRFAVESGQKGHPMEDAHAKLSWSQLALWGSLVALLIFCGTVFYLF